MGDLISRFRDYQIEWLTAHNDIEFCEEEEKLIIGFLKDTAECFVREETEQQWIPCSERLPDKEGEYLVTFHDEWNRNLVRALWYGTPFDLDDRTMWTFYCEHEYGFEAFKAEKPIVAWMPLPEPYKGGDE